jgi:hypothetical protein
MSTFTRRFDKGEGGEGEEPAKDGVTPAASQPAQPPALPSEISGPRRKSIPPRAPPPHRQRHLTISNEDELESDIDVVFSVTQELNAHDSAPPSPFPPAVKVHDPPAPESKPDILIEEFSPASAGVAGGSGAMMGVEYAAVRALFAELVSKYMSPVREFMLDLKAGEAQQNAIQVCAPAVKSLRRSAESMELTDLCAALDEFGAVLDDAVRGEERILRGEIRLRLLTAYNGLTEVMPDAFSLEGGRSPEDAVVNLLLLQVAGVNRTVLGKLAAAGLTTLAALFGSDAASIAATSGISRELALRIVKKAEGYRRDLQQSANVPGFSERQLLEALAPQLRKIHNEYEKASEGWSDDALARKRHLRQSRTEIFVRVQVLMARLGEVERVQAMEKVSFERRLERIERYLKGETGTPPDPTKR